jgi:hypothetical protein
MELTIARKCVPKHPSHRHHVQVGLVMPKFRWTHRVTIAHGMASADKARTEARSLNSWKWTETGLPVGSWLKPQEVQCPNTKRHACAAAAHDCSSSGQRHHARRCTVDNRKLGRFYFERANRCQHHEKLHAVCSSLASRTTVVQPSLSLRCVRSVFLVYSFCISRDCRHRQWPSSARVAAVEASSGAPGPGVLLATSGTKSRRYVPPPSASKCSRACLRAIWCSKVRGCGALRQASSMGHVRAACLLATVGGAANAMYSMLRCLF